MPIPSSGLFRIYPDNVTIVSGDFAVTSVGTPPAAASVATLDAYYDARLDDPATAPRLRNNTDTGGGIWAPGAGVYELSFSASSRIVLGVGDPGVETIDYFSADFPIGLYVNQCFLLGDGQYTGPTDGRGFQLSNIASKYNGATIQNLVPAGAVAGTIIQTPQFVTAFQRFGAEEILKFFGFAGTIIVNGAVINNAPLLRMDTFVITGVYNTAQLQFTLNTPNAGPGGEVSVTATTGSFLSFTSFKIKWLNDDGTYNERTIPSNFILTWTATSLIFRVPLNDDPDEDLIPYGGTRLALFGVGNGLPYTGDIQIANINVQLVNGSGVYTLVPGKTDDTYYDRSVSPVSTLDLKIPDPFIRSAFLKG